MTYKNINFKEKLQIAINNREEFYKDDSTTAFRIFNGSGDGIDGLTIDYFDGFYLFTWFTTKLYSFKDNFIKDFQQIVKFKGIYQKKKFNKNETDPDDAEDFICGEKASQIIIVKENNMNFAIELDDGAMVGVFLDQRDVRKTIRDKYSKGKTMLNTFSYTGAFSVAAALGGASKTTSVDLAKRSLPKTKKNFEINNIDISKQSIIVEDVFKYFKYAVRKELLFDLVVLDPPSFARTKKSTFSVAKDYVKLLKEAILITNSGGVIVASTNYANLTLREFKEFIDKAFKELNIRYEIEHIFGVPKDFKGSNYLKVVFIRKI